MKNLAFRQTNPWRFRKKFKTNSLPRELLDKILAEIPSQEIIVLTGARQVGKTTLLFQIIDYLLNKKRIPPKKIFYFNLDTPQTKNFVENSDQFSDFLLSKVETNLTKERIYVFLDEVQRLRNPGLILKGWYDLNLPIKFIVTGSSSLEVRSEIFEFLTGRKRLFVMRTLSFEEFLRWKEKSLTRNDSDRLHLWQEFVVFGGYPRVVLAQKHQEKLKTLKEIFSSFIKKDVSQLLKVEKVIAFENLVQILAENSGSLVNVEELSRTLRIHRQTVEKYLYYLEETYVISLVRPFFKRIGRELVKQPKVYFQDSGLRNFALSAFSDFEKRVDKGVLLETYLARRLQKELKLEEKLSFWRTLSGAEVDFILQKGADIQAFEAKASFLKKEQLSRSLRSFIRIYQPTRVTVVNLSLRAKDKIGKTKIEWLPAWAV